MRAVPENYMIQTVSRAMDLLEQFQEGNTELGITDLSNRMNLQKNNVFRLVATLTAKKYIEMNVSTGKYRLGIKTRALGQVATRLFDFTNLARPYLNALKLQCHETCYFSVIRDGYTYYLDGVESDLPVRVAQRIGSSRSLICTAAGKVQLAFMEPQKQIEMLSGSEMKGHSVSSINDLEILQYELNNVAKKGYAIDDQEHDAGVVEIAAPVFDSNGTVVGALSISGPEMRLAGPQLEKELLPFLCQSASRLSSALGYSRTKKTPAEINVQPLKSTIKIRTLENTPYAISALKNCF